MKTRTLFWQFFGTHILILFAAIGLLSFYTWYSSRAAFQREWVRELEMQARLAAALLPHADGSVDGAATARFFERLGQIDDHRVTLILPDGKVLADSGADAKRMELHNNRPEVIEAIKTGRGMSQRYSASLGKQMLYLAERVPQEGPVQAVVRVAVPVRTLMREMDAADHVLVVLLLVVLGATLALSYAAARRIIGPVSALQKGLTRIGDGELSCRLEIPPVPHLAALARSINHTADRLQKYIQDLNEERNLRTLILANMTRGVIAIDAKHAIMDINDSALRLLDLNRPAAEGTRIGEVVRYPELLLLIDESERGDGPVEKEMATGGASELLLNMRATALNDRSGHRLGTLMVLSDVTLLRRLETVRQDFVANVSHELRTPVTSIKGFAEALLDGAMNDPATADRFLKIIVRQAGQLESIIRDLLELSRLEQTSAQPLDRHETPVAGVLKSAIELCQSRPDGRSVTVSLSCEEGLTAVMHAGLVEQAVVNLIDNAIKYGAGRECAKVDVAAAKEGACVRITVRDYGQGIEHKYLERLFERFYRVDKGRSREMGGTGLGLAIVKHIVLIHNGTVNVESELGHGSTFILRLPA
jgi:two-component system phosphate regulon sensor histidine kinase PhoR